MREPATEHRDRATITPNETQQGIVDRHKKRIKKLTKDLVEMARESPEWNLGPIVKEHRYPPSRFKQPRKATTLAVIGPRGSGKSTCMVELIRELAKDPDAETLKVGEKDFHCLSGFLVVDQTVDCTLGPREVPLGLSALMRLRRVLDLDQDPQEAWSDRGEKRTNPSVEAEQQAFKAMREAYMLSRLAAGRVLESTSSSGSHFAQQAAGAAAGALALPDRVADWLQLAAVRLGSGVEGFILVLDDVDLARDGLRALVRSLLDELHQPRLILVLGVDLPRLERRVVDLADKDRKSELRVARDLLYKALPQQDREWLRPWKEEDRWTFPPRPAPTYPKESGSLKDLLLKRGDKWGVAIRNPALLPGFPRSLENVWFALWELKDEKMLDSVEDYLAYLAEARGEHNLARRISGRSVSAWTRHLIWPKKPISDTQWEHMVTSALEGSPLLGFQAESALPLPGSKLNAVLWVEVLVDLSLASSHLADGHPADGHLTPAELIRRFPRMNDLIDQAQIQTDFHRDDMVDQFLFARGSVMAQLAWTRFDVRLGKNGVLPELFGARVGLAPLHDAAERRRNAWPTILAQGLFLQRSDVLEDTGGADEEILILPRAVRSLIVFVDSLSLAPWRLLSETPRRRSLRINALLVAGLVYAAYVDALERIFNALKGRNYVNQAVKSTPSDADLVWLEAIRDHGNSPIMEWFDDDIEHRFHALLKQKIPYSKLVARDLPRKLTKHMDWEFTFASYNELVDCLNTYTKSRAFLGLEDPDFHEAPDRPPEESV